MDCETKYRKLCEDVAAYYRVMQTYCAGGKEIRLVWEPACKEINLWTYWQGRGHLRPKILLVGQDWGAPADAPDIMEHIRQMNRGESVPYGDSHRNPTDDNLTELFAELGYSIRDEDEKNKELFFTNLIPGYREHGISGGYQTAWLTPENQAFFRRLVDLLEPRVILCLGKATYTGVLASLNRPKPGKKSYNQLIQGDPEKFQWNAHALSVFPLAHCGAMGTMNRNREGKNINGQSLELQKQDWQRVKDFLEALEGK